MRIHCALFILLTVLASCAKQSTVPLPQEDILYQVEGFFTQKPDSVLQILDTLNLDMLSEKERAHYCLLRVCVYDALFKYDKETDSLLQVAENYFVGGKDKYFEARTCEALSRIAFKMGKGENINSIGCKRPWRALTNASMWTSVSSVFVPNQPRNKIGLKPTNTGFIGGWA